MTTDPDTYLPGPAYARLLGELAALRALPTHGPHDCPETWGVELLGLAGVWPDCVLSEAD